MIIIFASGCATTEDVGIATSIPTQGVYHKVKKGETIWRIANTYGVGIDDIIRSNNIPNVAKIEQDQLVFIPGAGEVKEISPSEEKEGSKDIFVDVNQESFVWPIQGKVIKFFGDSSGRNTVKGIEILGKEGESVSAARRGNVVFADYLAGYAYTVIIDHWDGYFSVYSQNSRILVALGEAVSKGDKIAILGRSGKLAYLHFEIRKNSVPDNPLYYLSH